AGEYLGYLAAFQSAAAAYLLAGLLAATLPHPPPRPAPRPHGDAPPRVTRWRRLAALADPGMVTVTLAAFLAAFMQQISGTFLPLSGWSAGRGLSGVGMVRVVTAGTNVFARGMGGPLTERIGRRRTQHIFITLQAIGLVALSFGASFWAVLAAMLWVASCRAI